jgi:hypothetical protein
MARLTSDTLPPVYAKAYWQGRLQYLMQQRQLASLDEQGRFNALISEAKQKLRALASP